MKSHLPSRITTDIPGLEKILHGGFLPGRSYLVTGGPGTGKTTMGLHFLSAKPEGEQALLVSLGEADRNIRADAESIGMRLEGVVIIDLSPTTHTSGDGTYTLLEPWEAEPPNIRARIETAFPEGPPARVFIDALSQFRHLVPDAFQFRKQVMALLEYLTNAGSTLLFTSEQGSQADEDLQYLGDGILKLDNTEAGRSLSIVKFRGSGFAEGRHTVRLSDQGMSVFERLMPGEYSQPYVAESIPSGVAELDALCGGGVGRGSVTIISGPTGVGKTSLGVQFMREAASRGERSVIFSFEENLATIRHRCERVGIPLSEMIHDDSLAVEEVEPLRYTPDEFAWRVQHEVEQRGATMVMIDSLSGYRQSMRSDEVVTHAHALCRYLSNMGVTVLLINEVGSISGDDIRVTELGISYLADAVLLLRYIEVDGEMRKTIGMLKKRTGDFEKTLREFDITAEGLKVGEPLTGLRGILRGVPELGSNGFPRGTTCDGG
ncbi:ATPase domain-containing protein [Billgrantia gudaonensis]|uniref:non-specific serine/threonine protein kinase n=1 Tax=Billgrantia gudaonensis TaxID=376427 RepID=A0A1G8ZSA4_9GAMM|nr:ATPase domain-containing protein [Halomonas gudaonensis]SDK17999.1 circadian clock protein KaiC [Halomonas gudaonensis]